MKKKASIADINEFLNQEYRAKITPDELAEIVYINKHYLTKSL